MKKLLIATDSFLPRWDGISRFLDEIVPRLSDHYEIKILAPDFKGEFSKYIDIEIIRFPLSRFKLADYPVPKPAYREISTHINEADIVWTQTIGPIGALAIIAAKRQKKPLAAYIHSIEWELFPKSIRAASAINWALHKSTSALTRYLYNKCDLIIVPSQKIADLMSIKGIKAPKKTIPLGTNTKLFAPPESKANAKKAVGIAPERLVVGFAGRIGREKDLETLYRAFGRINRKHNALLLIAGQDMAKVTERFRDNPKVMLIGHTNQISSYLKAMDVYVLPSLTETTSLSTIEAMSCQLAVLATPVGSLSEYIREGFNGMFFPKRNPYVLSKKLDLLLGDPVLRRMLGENARRTIINRFSWETTASEIESALDSLAEKKPAATKKNRIY
ncbi:glycosyltransferase family 4 protein [Candidatus Woesearchaeota archaeon]|nr:glycosyltransferase family 4 protein [Candidatus Woesearchaeota archaeon]